LKNYLKVKMEVKRGIGPKVFINIMLRYLTSSHGKEED